MRLALGIVPAVKLQVPFHQNRIALLEILANGLPRLAIRRAVHEQDFIPFLALSDLIDDPSGVTAGRCTRHNEDGSEAWTYSITGVTMVRVGKFICSKT